MNRLGLLTPESLSAEQKDFYDELEYYTTGKYGSTFLTRDKDGQFMGPFGVQLHTPKVGHHWLHMAKELANIPGLSSHNREIAILVVGAHTKAAYEVYAHERLSGFGKTDLDSIDGLKCPPSFNDEERLVFRMSNELCAPGPLDTETWEEAVKILGVSGATAVVQYVAFYKYVATILNGFDVLIPVSEEKAE